MLLRHSNLLKPKKIHQQIFKEEVIALHTNKQNSGSPKGFKPKNSNASSQMLHNQYVVKTSGKLLPSTKHYIWQNKSWSRQCNVLNSKMKLLSKVLSAKNETS
jgi:hypothetical protein